MKLKETKKALLSTLAQKKKKKVKKKVTTSNERRHTCGYNHGNCACEFVVNIITYELKNKQIF